MSEEEDALKKLNLNHIHFIAILVTYSISGLLFLMLVYFRHSTRRNMLDAIPHRIMPMLRPGDVSLRCRKKIIAELVRESKIEGQPSDFVEQKEMFEKIGHYGWGAPGTTHEGTHFKTSIARSYRILEKAASRLNPAWAREPGMGVREYVRFLRAMCKLPKGVCRRYIRDYEVARFSPREFTCDEWKEFRSNFLKIIKALTTQ